MSEQKLDQERIEELRDEEIPRASANEILEVNKSGEMSDQQKEYHEKVIKVADEYFSIFVSPGYKVSEKNKMQCLNCKTKLGGLFGEFRYAARHGEGFCNNCGYPCRADHYLYEGNKEENDKPLLRLNKFILRYHPEELEFEDEGQEN